MPSTKDTVYVYICIYMAFVFLLSNFQADCILVVFTFTFTMTQLSMNELYVTFLITINSPMINQCLLRRHVFNMNWGNAYNAISAAVLMQRYDVRFCNNRQ